jgi:uncharacterized DUF497 family protein
MGFEWDIQKAQANFKRHGVRFSEARTVLEDDDDAVTITDDVSDLEEHRFVTLGMGAKERLLVVVYCYRGDNIRMISVRLAEAHERKQYEEHR